MQKQKAEPEPTPSLSGQDDPLMPALMEHLSLNDKSSSMAGTQQLEEDDEDCSSLSKNNLNMKKRQIQSSCNLQKTKLIEKQKQKILTLKRSYKKNNERIKKQSNKKRFKALQNRISQLESQNERLKRKMQCCPQCRFYMHSQSDGYHFPFSESMQGRQSLSFQQEIKKIAGNLNDSRGSINSVQFQNIDFHAPMMTDNGRAGKELDDKAWVYTGIMMIAMGSKCLEVDGTISIFRILKQCVDTLRRQVEKSQKNISLDFYLTNEEMKLNDCIRDIGFDPFMDMEMQKISGNGDGLALDGIKIQSVQQFQLIYDSKLTYNVKYESLLGAMQHIRENSWLTY